MRERDDDAPGQESGSLAGGLGETSSGGVSGDPLDPYGDTYGDDTFGDGAPDDQFPSDPDTSVADGSLDDALDTDDGSLDSGAAFEPGDPAQSHSIMDGIEYLVDELREAVFGADDDPAATDPDPAGSLDDGVDDGSAGL